VNTRLHDDGRIASRILLVEPDDDTRGLHGQLLQQIGCEVVEAVDSRDALMKALTYQPALVMTEIHLPFVDGHARCELLRRESTTRSGRFLSSRRKARARN
jgi:CheY-like chemotaxis protein